MAKIGPLLRDRDWEDGVALPTQGQRQEVLGVQWYSLYFFPQTAGMWLFIVEDAHVLSHRGQFWTLLSMGNFRDCNAAWRTWCGGGERAHLQG